MGLTLFCLDFDETLMNTDRLRADLLDAIRALDSEELAKNYLEAYDTTRKEQGVRIPLVLRTMVERYGLSPEMHRELTDLFHEFPYQEYIYPGAEETVSHLKELGDVVILSDGDGFFQPQKIYATTMASLADDVVVIPSKVDGFDDLANYWPADRYVFIDDKPTVLAAAKEHFGKRAVTVSVRQGRYANTGEQIVADMSVPTIADVTQLSF